MVSRKLVAAAVILAVLIVLCATYRPDRAIRVATGFVADTVCAKTFVSGFDPQTVFAETTDRAGIRRSDRDSLFLSRALAVFGNLCQLAYQ